MPLGEGARSQLRYSGLGERLHLDESSSERLRAAGGSSLWRAFAIGLAQVTRLALPVLFLPLIARELAPEEAGRYLLYFQLAAYFAILAEFGSTIYLARRLALTSGPRAAASAFWADYVSRFLLFAATTPLAWAVGLWLGGDGTLLAFSIASGWLLGAGLPIFRQFAGSISSAVAIELATVAIYVGGMSTLFLWRPSAVAALGVFVASLAVSHLAQLGAQGRVVGSGARMSVRRAWRLARHRWRLLALRGFGALQSQATIPLLGVMLGASQVALYGMGERLFAVTSNLMMVVLSVSSPVLMRWELSGDGRRRRRVAIFALAALTGYALVCAAMVLVSSRLVTSIFGPQYAPSAQYFPALSVIYTIQVAGIVGLAAFVAPRGLGAAMLPAFAIGAVVMLVGGAAVANLGVPAVLGVRLVAELSILIAVIVVVRRNRSIGAGRE